MAQKPMTKTTARHRNRRGGRSGQDAASRALEALTEIVTREVAAGGAVTLPGLGKFVCRDRPEREVRNPLTGEKTIKPADRSAKVTISRQLKDVINA